MQRSPDLRAAATPETQPPGDPVFAVALAEIEDGLAALRAARPELSFETEPSPRRLAPQAAAFAATVEASGCELGCGRFVLLYDPAGQAGWWGPFRVIAYVRADLEPEIAADPLIGQVGWSWLTESLEARDASFEAPSGTVTRVVTEGFGSKRDEPVTTEFEMRASWSPAGADVAASTGTGHGALPRGSAESPGGARRGSPRPLGLDRHVGAWADALCVAAGLPPLITGVAQLRPPRTRLRP